MNRFSTCWRFLLAVALIGAAGTMHSRLLERRAKDGLNLAAPVENLPPLVAFTTVAMGGFRGLIADMLWLRSGDLQAQGRYFELVQLADWITKLEPRFTLIWAYQAWNMAYNISVLLTNDEDRWRWVRHGIGLLRDEGLVYNPGDAHLYRELGWLFQHKLGMRYDTSALYYQRAWAAEMTELFGGGRPEYEHLDAATIEKLKKVYKMVPARMQTVEAVCGPLDWRVPSAHAIYWAREGLPYAKGWARLALDRMVMQCLAACINEGRLIERGPVFTYAPYLAILPQASVEMASIAARYPDQDSIQTAWHNFQRMIALQCYVAGDRVAAEAWLARLRVGHEKLSADLDRFALETFVAMQRGGALDSPETLGDVVESAAYVSQYWMELGELNLAHGYKRLLDLSVQLYQKNHPDASVRADVFVDRGRTRARQMTALSSASER